LQSSPARSDRLSDEHALIAAYVSRLQSGPRSVLDSPSRLDEEHRLIARYAARLAAEAGNTPRPPTDLGFNFDANKQQRQLIAELENKNREILQEIQRLRLEHEQASQPTPEKAQQNPTLLAELRLLRQRKDELEQRMSALQESRRELMVQLEGLMKLLKEEEQKQADPCICLLAMHDSMHEKECTTRTLTGPSDLNKVLLSKASVAALLPRN
ncbi:hypothetical protein JD844_025904, partial [Phrynosoma platyrhinos]